MLFEAARIIQQGRAGRHGFDCHRRWMTCRRPDGIEAQKVIGARFHLRGSDIEKLESMVRAAKG
jgi:hypothetical protein